MKHSSLTSAFFNLRVLAALGLCLAGAALGLLALKNESAPTAEEPLHYMPTAGGDTRNEARDLERLEQFWSDRLTYPTGKFDPAWVRNAAAQHKLMPTGVPKGSFARLLNPAKPSIGQRFFTPTYLQASSPLSLSTSGFTSLGPSPLRMTGCSGCFDYTKTQARVNSIALDPTTTTPGSIVAYIGSVNGGVWKSTNCCTTSTTWTATTDDVLINTTAIDTVTIDPSNHNTIYAGTGDLNYGSFSMGSQGILKSTDGGATWTVKGANVFGGYYPEPTGFYSQYQAVGKVRVDPNNSNNVAAGTKTGLYLSHDGGNTWTQCATNSFNTQRQDITGLELSNMGGGVTRILAAVGTRGFPTYIQYDLGKNGANGIYKATMTNSGCPSFTSTASNANGFVFGTQVTGSPYLTGANMNAGSGTPCDYPYLVAGANTYCGNGAAGGTTTNGGTVNNLGRVDIAVAPSNANVIYAQVGSINWNNNSGCGNTTGCQIGVWSSIDGGSSWSFMAGSAGGSLRNCAGGNTSGNPGDYPQNWYNSGMAVDPNNPDRLFVDTYDTWFATRTGTSFFNTTCGYNGSSASAHVVHVDHHALAFLPGSSDVLLEGSDGGIFATTNASTTTGSVRPTWINMDTTQNMLEFYAGDISGNFANAAAPVANGGAQDNGAESVTFTGSPTGPVQWQMGLGGDGFSGQIDSVGTGTSLRLFQGNNSGGISRCTSACTASGASWTSIKGGWGSDTQNFALPINLFRGGIAGGDDCGPASATTGCGHLVAGTTRVWETITGAAATVTWYVTNNPTTANMTKATLGNRSYINQVKYSPKFQSVAIAGTNDGNVQIGFNLGLGVQATATWVDVTGGNSVLPNRPVQGVTLDPSVSAANMPIGYAALSGFNANSLVNPAIPGHIFQVTCTTANCASFTWVDKSGNLPDVPANCVIVNPNYPQQVFLGTDFGLYYTNNINQGSPLWYRFEAGLPHVMIWDLSIDRGSTTLSVWSRGRGAFVYPLPSTDISQTAPTLVSAVSRMTHGSNGTFDLPMPLDGSGVEPRSDGTGNFTIVMTFDKPPVSSNTSSSSGSVSNVSYSGNTMTVSLSGIADQQVVTVTANNVTGTNNAMQNVSLNVGFLLGDVNMDRSVNVGDTVLVRNNSGVTLDNTNCQYDVNADGLVNVGDTIATRNHSSDFLP